MSDRPGSTVRLNWRGGFKFNSTDAQGHTLTVDAPLNEGDDYEGLTPGDMLLTALAGCSGIDVVNILARQRQQVHGVEITVTGQQNPDPPWTWEDIHIHYEVRGHGLKEHMVDRAIQLSERKYCSIGATVGGRARISSTFDVVDAGSQD